MTKPHAEFPVDNQNVDGLHHWCKQCRNALHRRYGRSARYGLLDSVALELRARPCDLCGVPPVEDGPAHAIDHSHETGAVRGVLCRACNVAVGKIEGRMGGLARVAHYLTKPADYRDVDRVLSAVGKVGPSPSSPTKGTPMTHSLPNGSTVETFRVEDGFEFVTRNPAGHVVSTVRRTTAESLPLLRRLNGYVA